MRPNPPRRFRGDLLEILAGPSAAGNVYVQGIHVWSCPTLPPIDSTPKRHSKKGTQKRPFKMTIQNDTPKTISKNSQDPQEILDPGSK